MCWVLSPFCCYPRTLTESGRITGMSFKCSFYTNIPRFIVSLPPCTLKRNEVIIYIAASLVHRYIHWTRIEGSLAHPRTSQDNIQTAVFNTIKFEAEFLESTFVSKSLKLSHSHHISTECRMQYFRWNCLLHRAETRFTCSFLKSISQVFTVNC